MKLLIDKTAAQSVLDYLATRPYIEVRDLVPGLLNLQVYTPPVLATNEDETKNVTPLPVETTSQQ
jgi:hypothetical protein